MAKAGLRPGRAQFVKSASRWEDAPAGLPQVAVGGRSNVGKSSLINLLLGSRTLARTSSTPGRTQLLNFFEVDGRLLLVDLPGYGYAAAPRAEVDRWNARVREYVSRAEALKGVVLLLDVRRDPSPLDRAFAELVQLSGRRLCPVVTKADKVARGRRRERLVAIAAALGVDASALVVTSARERTGREELWTRVLDMLEERPAPAKALVVAIDGPSGSGKSTVARRLAARLGWSHIDTGAMYRSIGLKADRSGVALDDDEALEALCRATVLELGRTPEGSPAVLLDGEDVSEAIREHRVSDLASQVSARGPVRQAMSRYQRRLGCAAPAVLEGRDIGTVVFPDARIKVYLTASDAERARRRAEELRSRGQEVSEERVLADLRERDRNDSTREHAPLRAAEDAVVVDTTGLTVDEVVERLVRIVDERLLEAEPV